MELGRIGEGYSLWKTDKAGQPGIRQSRRPRRYISAGWEAIEPGIARGVLWKRAVAGGEALKWERGERKALNAGKSRRGGLGFRQRQKGRP